MWDERNYLSQKIQEGAISEAEGDLIAGYIAYRDNLNKTAEQTKKKQLYQCNFICQELHKRNTFLDACNVQNLIYVAGGCNKFTPNSRQTKIATLKALALYIDRFHHPIQNIELLSDVKTGTVDKNTKDLLSTDEWDTIINAPMSAKERAMIAMLYDGYHRPMEILLLKWSDLQPLSGGGIEYKITFKTAKPRTIVQKGPATAVLEMWRIELGAQYGDPRPVFPDNHGKPYQTITVLKNLCKELREKTGIKKIMPSVFRNSAITHDVQSGLPPSYICLRAWGETYNDMINVYSEPDSGKMQALQHQKCGVDLIPVVPDIGRKAVLEVTKCKCGLTNLPGAQFCYGCGEALTEEAREVVDDLRRDVHSHPDAFMAAITERMQQLEDKLSEIEGNNS